MTWFVDPEIAVASTLDHSFYRDEATYALARERIFARTWQWLGSLDDVAAPQSLSPRDLLPGMLDEPLLLARDEAGDLRCMSNVCTHRGNILVKSPCKSGHIRCGYHSRRFDLAGRMTFMPEFADARNFPSPRDDLPQVPFAAWAGQGFAALDPALPFGDFLGDASARVAFLPLERFRHDATRAELGQQLQKKTRLTVSQSTICRGLQTLTLTLKKKTKLAAEADPDERAAFRQTQQTLPIESLVFLDEFASNIAMTRTRARAPQGVRAEMVEPFERGQNMSTIAAVRLRGVCAPMMLEGAFDSESFELYVEQMLVPELRVGDRVVLDNVRFHHAPRARRLIAAAGAFVLHLPAYSPDFNPIEECISKLKECLRSLKARTKRKLRNALAKALQKVTTEDILGWFTHCGYTYSLN